MKNMKNSINTKFSQGFNNILSPSLINLFIALSLLIIISLSYLKYNKIELYEDTKTNKTTANEINKINLNTDTGYMSSIVRNYLRSKQIKNEMQIELDYREQQIQDISSQLNELIS